MNNFSMKLKKALGNKNIVTALCFLLIGIILIVGYQWRLNSATAPIKIPYALKTIDPQTEITEDMVGTLEIASDSIKNGKLKGLVYTQKKSVVGMYANLQTTIYKGSFFYKDSIVKKESLASASILDIPDGSTPVTLNINMQSSYYNSFVPGDYFDLYVRTIGTLEEDKSKSKDQEILFGKLIDKIKILGVKTSNGENVFSNGEKKVPSGLVFALPEKQFLLYKKAEYFSKLQNVAVIQFIAVPRGQKYKTEDGTTPTSTVTSEQLEKYINDKTKDIDVKQIIENPDDYNFDE